MSSVRSAMCWQPGDRYQSRYSWIWLFFLPEAGSLIGELDPAVAVGHDLGHERAVVGVDDLVVVVDQLGEAQHVPVVVDELVHLAQTDVPDAVIDLEQAQPARPRAPASPPSGTRARRCRDSRAGPRTSAASRRTSGWTRGGGSRPPRRRSRSASWPRPHHASWSRATPTRHPRPRTRCRGRRRRARGRARRSRHPGSGAP